LTRRLAVCTLLPVTLASATTPENPAVVDAASLVEVAALVAAVVAAAPPPSSPPQPASRQPAASSITTNQRERVIRGSFIVGGDTLDKA
jgi:hypothetical protein